jgi:hypothetical protein
MQDRSINVGGNFNGVANTGDDSVIHNSQAPVESDVSEVVAEILNDLKQRYPNALEAQKQMVFQMELQQKISQNPTLKARLLNAAKSGGFEIVKVLTNNPFVSIPLEMFKGWIEA